MSNVFTRALLHGSWRPWFAWYPVPVVSAGVVRWIWWEEVERRGSAWYNYDYREGSTK